MFSASALTSTPLYSPYLLDPQDPFESNLLPAVPANTFSADNLGDDSFLDPTPTWPVPEDSLPWNTGINTSTPCLEPSQLQRHGTTNITSQQQRYDHSVPSFRTREKEVLYTPGWTSGKKAKAESMRQPSKLRKQATASSAEASKAPQLANSGSESDSSFKSRLKGKGNHNQVEKQYRNRLNGQFDKLLSALPAKDANGSRASSEQQGRRVSKAEVLIMAKEHIAALEDINAALERERKMLTSKIRDFKSAWVSSGGKLIP